jgi:hypothetical protein
MYTCTRLLRGHLLRAQGSSTHDDDLSFTNAFINLDPDALNKLDSFKNAPLQDWFTIDMIFYEPAIYIKDDACNFPVDLEVIAMV